MRNTIFSVILILTTISCASLMDFDGAYRSDGSAVVDPNPYDPMSDLLLGFYISSLITNPPQTRYYYSPLSRYSFYLPPPASLSPVYRYLWIQSEIESELRDYENKIKRINWDLEDEARRLIDEIKRAKEKD